MKKFIDKIFSIKRVGMNKVFCVFGIKIKLPIYTNCYLPDAKMLKEQNVDFPHPIGIVISVNAKLGKNCQIYQNVTIGSNNGKAPVLGDNVKVYAGACIIGGVKIGNNVQVGANAVVVKDVPDNCIVAGVPAKIIKRLEVEE